MRRRKIGFTYTRTVVDPPDQRGRAGEHRDLPAETAEHLESLGYGWRDGHEPPPEPDDQEEIYETARDGSTAREAAGSETDDGSAAGETPAD